MESGLGYLEVVRQAVIDGLFPRFCLRCKREGEWVCRVCLESSRPMSPVATCVFCGTPSLAGRTCTHCASGRSLDGCLSVGWYADPVLRQAIAVWKYHGDQNAWSALERWVRGSDVFSRLPPGEWMTTEVPLHTARQRERGFNQAEAIAAAAAQRLHAPHAKLLARAAWTEPQARRGSKERAVGDLDGAFRPIARPPTHVLLCDDVVTTAATLDAAAQALKAAGAEQVWGFTLARGGKG